MSREIPLVELNEYDWKEAYEYAHRVSLCEGASCSADSFTIAELC
jgi:hypothetical protein